jgi:hypothetical protein
VVTDYASIDLDALTAGAERRRHRLGRRWIRRAALAGALLVLPFVALLRGAAALYGNAGVPAWLAITGGATLALACVTLIGALASRAMTGRARVRFVAVWLAFPLVASYVGHSLLFLAAVNAKSGDVRAHYTSLHPLLRLSVRTLILLDDGVVLTDLARGPGDFERMGLPRPEWSLHYPQDDGWVHALDLRTIGRSTHCNWLTSLYFRALGFRVLRHVGTADHLHVSLPLPRPASAGRRWP